MRKNRKLTLALFGLVIGSFISMLAFKIMGIIYWSWWIVFSPVLVPIFIYLIGILIGSTYSKFKK